MGKVEGHNGTPGTSTVKRFEHILPHVLRVACAAPDILGRDKTVVESIRQTTGMALHGSRPIFLTPAQQFLTLTS